MVHKSEIDVVHRGVMTVAKDVRTEVGKRNDEANHWAPHAGLRIRDRRGDGAGDGWRMAPYVREIIKKQKAHRMYVCLWICKVNLTTICDEAGPGLMHHIPLACQIDGERREMEKERYREKKDCSKKRTDT